LLFKLVIMLHRLAVDGKMDAATLVERRTHLESWIDRLLDESVELAGESRIRNRLRKQRSHLIGCLYDLSAEPTNNRAERSLRPAVFLARFRVATRRIVVVRLGRFSQVLPPLVRSAVKT
jgi:hypothetical protein